MDSFSEVRTEKEYMLNGSILQQLTSRATYISVDFLKNVKPLHLYFVYLVYCCREGTCDVEVSRLTTCRKAAWGICETQYTYM